MKVVAAIDSFKGSMTSSEAGQAARKGVLRVFPSAQVVVMPVADGGEGTVEVLTDGLCGTYRTVTV
ncbi:MAG: glycerate kinase, partial [Clostridia bacterium]|nr:glycerate kinase [Clostridia bacterium]